MSRTTATVGVVPRKYVSIAETATLVHHCGPTTLPGHPPTDLGGQTILCLHDAGGNGNCFADLLDALAGRHTPVSYDQPGHGRSGSLDSLGEISAMADHCRDTADALGLSAPVLLGEGMGVSVALAAAAADPAWPSALVLTGGAAASYDNLAGEIEQLTAITSGRARREFDSTGYAPDTPRPIYGKAFAEWVKTDPRATVKDRIGQAAFDGAAITGSISCPVLVVVGEHEEPEFRANAEALVGILPNARVTEVPGAGRRGVIEQPAALADLIDNFLAEVIS